MRTLQSSMLGLCVTLLSAAAANAQEQQPRRPAFGVDQFGGPLVAKAALEKLNLSAEQKEKVAKIEKEFAEKTKDSETKLRELIDKARQDKDRAAYQQAQEKINDAKKVRADYVGQVKALLTDEQKRTLEQPATRSRVPGAAAPPPSGPLPGALQERLGLSAEQKEKLSQLQKEFESKSLQVLTEEQRQKYEQLKKGRTRQPETPRQRSGASRLERTATPPALGRRL